MEAEPDQARECPSCGKQAEPEQDGDLVYYACACGFEFGYRRMPQDGACQLGVPEDVRRFASGGVIPAELGGSHDQPPPWLRVVADPKQPVGVMTVDTGAERKSVFIGGTIRRRPGV